MRDALCCHNKVDFDINWQFMYKYNFQVKSSSFISLYYVALGCHFVWSIYSLCMYVCFCCISHCAYSSEILHSTKINVFLSHTRNENIDLKWQSNGCRYFLVFQHIAQCRVPKNLQRQPTWWEERNKKQTRLTQINCQEVYLKEKEREKKGLYSLEQWKMYSGLSRLHLTSNQNNDVQTFYFLWNSMAFSL